MKIVRIGDITVGAGQPLVLIAGPCVIESEAVVLETMDRVQEITARLEMPFIFKSSYTKANRSSIDYYTGPGLARYTMA